ncbi:hypothetical protein B0H10DRAFT_1959063 [Mycena sp. CBHHK59/15]|nr:hypothetical protein B0H10DRAFT_1959063 [Mycena sp. CBHHK59/15]
MYIFVQSLLVLGTTSSESGCNFSDTRHLEHHPKARFRIHPILLPLITFGPRISLITPLESLNPHAKWLHGPSSPPARTQLAALAGPVDSSFLSMRAISSPCYGVQHVISATNRPIPMPLEPKTAQVSFSLVMIAIIDLIFKLTASDTNPPFTSHGTSNMAGPTFGTFYEDSTIRKPCQQGDLKDEMFHKAFDPSSKIQRQSWTTIAPPSKHHASSTMSTASKSEPKPVPFMLVLVENPARVKAGRIQSLEIHVPVARVQESLWPVNSIGVIVRWNTVIKQRVYNVQGSNALWHMDGNEKLHPWGFYVHGCVDGHSSSTQNIHMERGWHNIWKDTLESFGEIFMYLEEQGLLHLESPVHRFCLFVVFQPHIQKSLDETVALWNLHKIRTAGNKTPLAIYQLSKEKAINREYWTGDPGDDLETILDPAYGHNPNAPLPLLDELRDDPTAPDYMEYPDVSAEREAGIVINDDEVEQCKQILKNIHYLAEDGNSGIDIYCQAVLVVTEYFANQESS